MARQTRVGRSTGIFALVLGLAAFAGCGGGATKKAPTTPEELPAQDKVRMAQSYLGAGRTGEAMALLEQAIADEPNNAQLQLFYGRLSYQAGKLDQAERALGRALELDSYLTDAHNLLGAVYANTNRPAEAEREFRTALASPAYPTPEMVYLNLALLYSSQGRNDEAISNLRSAVEISPKYYQAHFELASLLDREGNIEEAAREYEVALPAYRNVGEFHYRLGFAYFRLGERSKARESLERAISVSPGSNSAAQADELLKMME
jgi:type IV pilus assembly protein PilF